MTIPERVAAHLGKGGDATVLALAGEHVAIITAMVKAYTRGRGFVGTIPAPDVEAVIVTAAARFTANPEQVERYQAADYAETPTRFLGFTLPELAVLNRYRKRAAG